MTLRQNLEQQIAEHGDKTLDSTFIDCIPVDLPRWVPKFLQRVDNQNPRHYKISIATSTSSSKHADVLRIKSELARAREQRLEAELQEAEHDENRSGTSRAVDKTEIDELQDRLGLVGLSSEAPSGSGAHHSPRQPEQCQEFTSPTTSTAFPAAAHATPQNQQQHDAIHIHNRPHNSVSRNVFTPLFSAPVAECGNISDPLCLECGNPQSGRGGRFFTMPCGRSVHMRCRPAHFARCQDCQQQQTDQAVTNHLSLAK